MKRRRLLGVVATGFLGGCLSRGGSPSETPTPNETSAPETTITTTSHTNTGDPSTDSLDGTPTSSGQCASNYEHVVAYTGYPTVTDRLNGFALRSSKTAVQQTDELTLNLTNETTEEKYTGNRSTYDIQRRTDAGWQSIFWKPTDEVVYYHSDAVVHSPGDGFTWELLITPEGLSHQIQNGEGHLKVCSSLPAGSYRFVYHGLTSSDGGDSEAVLGTQFTVSND